MHTIRDILDQVPGLYDFLTPTELHNLSCTSKLVRRQLLIEHFVRNVPSIEMTGEDRDTLPNPHEIIRALQLTSAEVITVEAVKSGFSPYARTFKVTTPSRAIIIRCFNSTTPTQYIVAEIDKVRLMARGRIAPTVLRYGITEQRYIASEYINGSPLMTTALTPPLISKLANLLHRIHSSSIIFPRPKLVLPTGLLKTRQETARSILREKPHFEIFQWGLFLLENLSKLLHPSCTIHYDLNPLNVLCSATKTRIIDWEMAGMGDPVLDLATIVVTRRFNTEQERLFLSQYSSHSPIDLARYFNAKQIATIRMGISFFAALGMEALLDANYKAHELPPFNKYDPTQHGPLSLRHEKDRFIIAQMLMRQVEENLNLTRLNLLPRTTLLPTSVAATASGHTPTSYQEEIDNLLFQAAYEGNEGKIRIGLAKGAQINSQHKDPRNALVGKTPLFIAAELGHYPAVKTLLLAGANPFITDQGGWKPYDVALVMEHQFGRVACSPCVIALKVFMHLLSAHDIPPSLLRLSEFNTHQLPMEGVPTIAFKKNEISPDEIGPISELLAEHYLPRPKMPILVEKIVGGLSPWSSVYKISQAGNEVAVMKGMATETTGTRATPPRALIANMLAANINVAPSLFGHSYSRAVLLMKYSANVPGWKQEITALHLIQLARLLKRLHQNPGLNSFGRLCPATSPKANMLLRRGHMIARTLPKPDCFEIAARHYSLTSTLLRRNSDQLCLIHGDLNPGNILFDGKRIYLIDYEFIELNHPFYDLATVTTLMRLTSEQSLVLLTSYLGKEPTKIELALFYIAQLNVLARYSFMTLALCSAPIEIALSTDEISEIPRFKHFKERVDKSSPTGLAKVSICFAKESNAMSEGESFTECRALLSA